MNDNIIRRVFVLGTLAIIGILAVQSFWVMRTWSLTNEAFHQKVNIALQKVAQNLSDYDGIALPNYNLVQRKSSSYYVVNIDNVIDAGVLEHYLVKQFEAAGLNTTFEYAIYDCSKDDFQFGNTCTVGDPEKSAPQPGLLPKYDEFIYYFVVNFSDRKSYLLGEMTLTVFFTIILLLAVLFFVYSLYIILNQKRLSEMQRDFINNMTHEFKTPISTIKVSADVFLDHPTIQTDDRLKRYASIIQEQNLRLNNQVEKVLQFAKTEKDSLKLNLEPVDLHQFLKDCLPGIELKIHELNGAITTKLNAKGSTVQADQVHLGNVINNLLDNAIKYRKGIPKIVIRTESDGRNIRLHIKDNGIGIPKEHQKKIFQKFYRVPTGDIHNVKGFGLGLFYIKNICDRHNWNIKLKSQAGKGTSITIEIKLV